MVAARTKSAKGDARTSKRPRSSANPSAEGNVPPRQLQVEAAEPVAEPASTSSTGLTSSARETSPLTDLSDAESKLSSPPSSSYSSCPSSSRSRRSSRTPDFSSSLTRASANYLRDSDIESEVDFADLLERAKRPKLELEAEPKPQREKKGKAKAEPAQVADEPRRPAQTELPHGLSYEPGQESTVLIRRRRHWWPAYLTGFTPGEPGFTSRLQEARYGVSCRDFADLREVMPWDLMLLNDERLASCTLGKNIVTKVSLKSDAEARPPTPEPEEETPQPRGVAFLGLSREQQLRAVRPYLLSVLREECPPAQPRNDRFFSKAKRNLGDDTVLGDITEDEVAEVLVPELQRWAFRRDRWRGWPDEELRPPEPPRPLGSQRYEALGQAARRSYVLNVLVPEAITGMAIQTMQAPSDDAAASAEVPSQDTYDKAVEYLRELSRRDNENQWEERDTEIAWARRRLRREQGLPPEDLSRLEKEEMELATSGHTRSRGGRIVKKTAKAAEAASQAKKRKLSGGKSD